MMLTPDSLPDAWRPVLAAEFDRPALRSLAQFLDAEQAAGKRIYPPQEQRFAALACMPPDAVRVVILGQDPYHGPGQAHGLSFSVPPGVPKPPSLRNIFQELQDDLGYPDPGHGCLNAWAGQGVLLLNTVLSVEDGQANAHAKRGWEPFTDAIIAAVAARSPHVAFVLWGAHAQKKARAIDPQRHLLLQSAHPSPLSAYRGFFGSKPFSKSNAFLTGCGLEPIDWRLPPAPGRLL